MLKCIALLCREVPCMVMYAHLHAGKVPWGHNDLLGKFPEVIMTCWESSLQVIITGCKGKFPGICRGSSLHGIYAHKKQYSCILLMLHRPGCFPWAGTLKQCMFASSFGQFCSFHLSLGKSPKSGQFWYFAQAVAPRAEQLASRATGVLSPPMA